MFKLLRTLAPLSILALLLTGCGSSLSMTHSGTPHVLAVETFLWDITGAVAGERQSVDVLIPAGVDPHSFEPAPQDVTKIADADLIIENGLGLEAWMQKTIENAGGAPTLVEASAGLTPRTPRAGELIDPAEQAEGDPHFWLDPNNVIQYTLNIRDALTKLDPAGKDVYAANADAYIVQLKDLDTWITQQVAAIPADQRVIVTNHETLGYFADRYGFTIVGTILPGVTTNASPSAQDLAKLTDRIRSANVKAIFLETGANPQLADQIALETGVKVVTDLYTHSLSAADGPAPTYLEMMRHNVNAIVSALQEGK